MDMFKLAVFTTVKDSVYCCLSGYPLKNSLVSHGTFNRAASCLSPLATRVDGHVIGGWARNRSMGT